MIWFILIVVGIVAAILGVGMVVGATVGGAIRERDRQVPRG